MTTPTLGVRLALLGPLGAYDADGAELSTGGPKQQLVLATLMLEPNRVVPADRLIDRLWGEDRRRASTSTLQVYVHNLRRILESGTATGGPEIVTKRPGYLLRAAPPTLDHLIFEELIPRARSTCAEGDPAAALLVLDRALSLWRGRALDGLPRWTGSFGRPTTGISAASMRSSCAMMQLYPRECLTDSRPRSSSSSTSTLCANGSGSS
ncbi:MAG: winged helix-turn-helix domain-containing protein [Nocardioidaceae bacterium]